MEKLTAEQFKEKYPKAEKNDNFLKDVACFGCGAREGFGIRAHVEVLVQDDDIDDQSGTQFEEYDPCSCQCGASGTVADFTIDGLDAIL